MDPRLVPELCASLNVWYRLGNQSCFHPVPVKCEDANVPAFPAPCLSWSLATPISIKRRSPMAALSSRHSAFAGRFEMSEDESHAGSAASGRRPGSQQEIPNAGAERITQPCQFACYFSCAEEHFVLKSSRPRRLARHLCQDVRGELR